MSALAVTFAILRIGGSAAELGLVLAAGMVPSLLLTLLGGVAGDRWERRRILLTADLVLAMVQASLALLLLSGQGAVWHFLVAELIAGAAGAFSWPMSAEGGPATSCQSAVFLPLPWGGSADSWGMVAAGGAAILTSVALRRLLRRGTSKTP
jgi:MFS family permease